MTSRLLRNGVQGLCGIIAVFYCASKGWASPLEIDQAWMPLSPSSMYAGYFAAKNVTTRSIAIVGFESPQFHSVSLHDIARSDDRIQMIEIASIELAPGDSLLLTPGAKHLMLMGGDQTVKEGDLIGVDVLLADGQRVPISLLVKAW